MRRTLAPILLCLVLVAAGCEPPRLAGEGGGAEPPVRLVPKVTDEVATLAYPDAKQANDKTPLAPVCQRYYTTPDTFETVAEWYRVKLYGSKLPCEGYAFVGDSGKLIADAPDGVKQVTYARTGGGFQSVVVVTGGANETIISVLAFATSP
jgi:hypothetical protein